MKEIIHPISFSAYRQIPAASNSSLKAYDRSPAHAKQAFDAPREPTDEMTFGSLTDHLLFGTEFSYAVSPFDDFRTKDAKAWKESQESAGIRPLKGAVYNHAARLVKSINEHGIVRQLMQSGRSQVALVAEVEGVPCKALVDWVSDEIQALADLKTTDDASPRAFSRHAYAMGYDVQAALYTDIWKAITGEQTDFVIIAAEREPPYAVACYLATPAFIETGRTRYKVRLAKHAECVRTGVWPAFGDDVIPLDPPPWAAGVSTES